MVDYLSSGAGVEAMMDAARLGPMAADYNMHEAGVWPLIENGTVWSGIMHVCTPHTAR